MSAGGSDPGHPARSPPSGRRGASIAILAAQVEEVAPLLARIGAKFDGKDRAARYWWSEVDRWAIAVSGMGRRRARAAAAALLDRSKASHLMVIGVGGALTPDLAVGALVVADRVLAAEAPALAAEAPAIDLDPRALRAAVEAGARAATVITVDRMIATVAERTALRALATGNDTARSAVVDMESYDAVAQAAARGVPATVLRAISDESTEELPEFLERSRKPDGDLDRRLAMLLAMIHAGSIPTLLALRRRLRRCSETLADVLPGLIASLDRRPAPPSG